MNGQPPKDLIELARRVAREELADAEDPYIRQIAGQVGAVVCQKVWGAMAEER